MASLADRMKANIREGGAGAGSMSRPLRLTTVAKVTPDVDAPQQAVPVVFVGSTEQDQGFRIQAGVANPWQAQKSLELPAMIEFDSCPFADKEPFAMDANDLGDKLLVAAQDGVWVFEVATESLARRLASAPADEMDGTLIPFEEHAMTPVALGEGLFGARNAIRQCRWHPHAPEHVAVLTDTSLTLFDVTVSLVSPVLTLDLSSAIPFGQRASSFDFGQSRAAFEQFAVFVLAEQGDVYCFCPVVPPGMRVAKTVKDRLLEELSTVGLGPSRQAAIESWMRSTLRPDVQLDQTFVGEGGAAEWYISVPEASLVARAQGPIASGMSRTAIATDLRVLPSTGLPVTGFVTAGVDPNCACALLAASYTMEPVLPLFCRRAARGSDARPVPFSKACGAWTSAEDRLEAAKIIAGTRGSSAADGTTIGAFGDDAEARDMADQDGRDFGRGLYGDPLEVWEVVLAFERVSSATIPGKVVVDGPIIAAGMATDLIGDSRAVACLPGATVSVLVGSASAVSALVWWGGGAAEVPMPWIQAASAAARGAESMPQRALDSPFGLFDDAAPLAQRLAGNTATYSGHHYHDYDGDSSLGPSARATRFESKEHADDTAAFGAVKVRAGQQVSGVHILAMGATEAKSGAMRSVAVTVGPLAKRSGASVTHVQSLLSSSNHVLRELRDMMSVDPVLPDDLVAVATRLDDLGTGKDSVRLSPLTSGVLDTAMVLAAEIDSSNGLDAAVGQLKRSINVFELINRPTLDGKMPIAALAEVADLMAKRVHSSVVQRGVVWQRLKRVMHMAVAVDQMAGIVAAITEQDLADMVGPTAAEQMLEASNQGEGGDVDVDVEVGSIVHELEACADRSLELESRAAEVARLALEQQDRLSDSERHLMQQMEQALYQTRTMSAAVRSINREMDDLTAERLRVHRTASGAMISPAGATASAVVSHARSRAAAKAAQGALPRVGSPSLVRRSQPRSGRAVMLSRVKQLGRSRKSIAARLGGSRGPPASGAGGVGSSEDTPSSHRGAVPGPEEAALDDPVSLAEATRMLAAGKNLRQELASLSLRLHEAETAVSRTLVREAMREEGALERDAASGSETAAAKQLATLLAAASEGSARTRLAMSSASRGRAGAGITPAPSAGSRAHHGLARPGSSNRLLFGLSPTPLRPAASPAFSRRTVGTPWSTPGRGMEEYSPTKPLGNSFAAKIATMYSTPTVSPNKPDSSALPASTPGAPGTGKPRRIGYGIAGVEVPRSAARLSGPMTRPSSDVTVMMDHRPPLASPPMSAAALSAKTPAALRHSRHLDAGDVGSDCMEDADDEQDGEEEEEEEEEEHDGMTPRGLVGAVSSRSRPPSHHGGTLPIAAPGQASMHASPQLSFKQL